MRRVWQRLVGSAPYRAWTRLGDARGNLLAAGIAYFSFFSLFPALALAAVAFGLLLRDRPDLRDAVGEALNQQLPGFVATAANPDGLVELRPPDLTVLSVTGVVAFGALVVAGSGWIGSMRDGIRTVFGAPGSPGNLLTDRIRDIGVLILLGVAVLLSAVLTSVLGGAASWLSQRIGLVNGGPLVVVVGLVVSLLVDAAMMLVLLRVLSGVSLPFPAIRDGVLVGAVGMTTLKAFAGQLLAVATRSPLFGSIVLVVGLLFWLNLIARLILFAAAWAANDLEAWQDAQIQAQVADGTAGGVPVTDHVAPTALLTDRSSGVDPRDPRDRAERGLPTLSTRGADRSSLAAGVVIGATVGRGVSAVTAALRRLLRRGN